LTPSSDYLVLIPPVSDRLVVTQITWWQLSFIAINSITEDRLFCCTVCLNKIWWKINPFLQLHRYCISSYLNYSFAAREISVYLKIYWDVCWGILLL